MKKYGQRENHTLPAKKIIKEMTFDEKHGYMRNAVCKGIGTNTFEISYTGRVPWCGLDRYITDVSPCIDMTLSGGISIEVFSITDTFCVNIMQRSPERKYVQRFSELLLQSGITYKELSPAPFRVCAFRFPEKR